jgi:hypothetical protein
MSDAAFIHKTAALARRAPQEWAEFLAAFKEYSNVRAVECVRAPRHALQTTQGRAQQTASLLALFEGAVKKSDALESGRGK